MRGIAGPSNDAWLADHGAVPVNYGDSLLARLRAAAQSGHIDTLLDFFGGYVAMAIEELRLPREKVDTIARFRRREVVRSTVKGRRGCRDLTAAPLWLDALQN